MGAGWCQGKNEVLALSEEIGRRLETQSVLQIHRDLTAVGKVSVSREIFARNVKKYIKSAGEQSPAVSFVHSSSQSSHSQKSKQPTLPLVPTAPIARGVSARPVSDDPLDRRLPDVEVEF